MKRLQGGMTHGQTPRRGGWNAGVPAVLGCSVFVAGLLFVWVTNRFAYYRSRQVLFVVGILMMIFSGDLGLHP